MAIRLLPGMVFVLCSGLAIGSAIAQDRAARVPSTQQIIDQLKPRAGESTRAFTTGGRGISVEGGQPRPAKPPAIDLDVNFEYASARLSADAKLVLDNLGRALHSPELRSAQLRIAGHTDATGTDAYNIALSRQRAQSVADYLVRQYGIAAQRLEVEGFGKRRLIDPANPASALNRRVEVTNLSAQ